MVIRILFLLLLPIHLYSQNNGIFRIYLTDKNNSPYSLSQPDQFLSQKALNRRIIQSINLDNRDLPISPVYLDSIQLFSNIYIHSKSKWMNTVSIETDSVTLDSVLNLSFVQNAVRLKSKEYISEVSSDKFNVPTERRWNSSSENEYGDAFPQIHIHNGERLHHLNFRGEGMTIAVLDAGFPGTNTEEVFSHLFSENKVLGTYNFVSDITDVYSNTHVHGTLVLSCMATKSEYKHVGTAPNANYYFFVTENADTETPLEEDNWVEAAEFADSAGVDLINTSLGYTTYDDSTLSYSYSDLDGNTTFISRGADVAASRGILVVVSAGNNGSSSWFRIGAPADADSVLTVGGVGADRVYASFSSKGPSYDGQIKPDIAAVGYSAALIWPGNPNVSFGSGTSFASPLSCGLAACLWQAHPDKNNMEIIQAIHQSASQYNSPDSLIGYGIPDFYLAHQILSGAIDQSDFFYVQMFPNPFQTEIQIDLFAAEENTVSIEIFSVTGEFIYATETSILPHVKNRITLQRNFENLSSGLYFIHIHSGTNEIVYKVNYIKP